MTDDNLRTVLEPLAAKLARILDDKAAIEAEERDIKAQIREVTAELGPDVYDAGPLSIVVSTNSRFDEAKALGLIPADLTDAVTYPKTCVDRDRLRVLAPEIYAAATRVFDNRIAVK